MSLKILHLAAALEGSDEFHEARLMLLLRAAGGKGQGLKPVDGIMKLAKMDFLLRYPNILDRALRVIGENKKSAIKLAKMIPEEDKDTIEARMIRFRFGPWDPRYRKWLSVLSSKKMVVVTLEGRTVKISLTDKGVIFCDYLAASDVFDSIVRRSSVVCSLVGGMSSSRITDFVYKVTPELLSMKWGELIDL